MEGSVFSRRPGLDKIVTKEGYKGVFKGPGTSFPVLSICEEVHSAEWHRFAILRINHGDVAVYATRP